MTRLPGDIRAYLFDMDGVLTDTASVHAEAWKRTFDEFLRARQGACVEESPEDRLPHDAGADDAEGALRRKKRCGRA